VISPAGGFIHATMTTVHDAVMFLFPPVKLFYIFLAELAFRLELIMSGAEEPEIIQ
jgi:hypothetical protein